MTELQIALVALAGIVSVSTAACFLRMVGAMSDMSGISKRANERERNDLICMIERLCEKLEDPDGRTLATHARERSASTAVKGKNDVDVSEAEASASRPPPPDGTFDNEPYHA